MSAKSLTLSKEFEGSNELEFEYALLGLGSAYNPPSRPASASKRSAIDAQRAMQKAIRAAESVLIVGHYYPTVMALFAKLLNSEWLPYFPS